MNQITPRPRSRPLPTHSARAAGLSVAAALPTAIAEIPRPARRGHQRALTSMIGWTAIVVFGMFVTMVLLQGAGGSLRLIFPVLACAVGGYLYFACPRLYLGFSWWLWFLVPEIRRIADYQGGWNPVNEMMLSPLLVSCFAGFTLIKLAPQLRLKTYVGFVPILIALFYGTIVGAVTTGPTVAVYALLTWLAPVLLCFHVAARWREYDAHREVLLQTFGWGALVMGAYGLIQYFFAPPWDCVWIYNSGMINQGDPYPRGLRVWSTMNSSGPFAFAISCGLLLLMTNPVRFRAPMFVLGMASLLLSLVRAAWLGLGLGVVYLLISLRGGARWRLLMYMVVGTIVLAGAVTTGPLAEVIGDRFKTLSELNDDGSYQQRQDFYADFLMRSLTKVAGEGIGSTSYVTKLGNDGEISSGFYGDSGVLQIPFVLGWFGSIFYLGGLGMLVWQMFASRARRGDGFIEASKAIVLVIAAEMIFENTLINVMGACFWTFMGMCLAARQMHGHQQAAREAARRGDPELSHVNYSR